MSNEKLTDLEVSRAIAMLKGLIPKTYGAGPVFLKNPMTGSHKIYEPITDNAINLELRDEYEVEIDYSAGEVSIYGDVDNPESNAGYDLVQIAIIEFTDKSQINRAVCLCILESVK